MIRMFLSAWIVVLTITITNPAWAPVFNKQHQLALYILQRHANMCDWLEAVGRKRPYPLPYTRALEYSEIFFDLAKKHDLEEQLFKTIIPYVDQECGFVNGINDHDLEYKAHGLFGLQRGTAQDVANNCKRYNHTRHWTKAIWKSMLVLNFFMNSDIGFELMGDYLDDYNQNPETVFQAMVGGPGGVRNNVEVNFTLFRERQAAALELEKFLMRLDNNRTIVQSSKNREVRGG